MIVSDSDVFELISHAFCHVESSFPTFQGHTSVVVAALFITFFVELLLLTVRLRSQSWLVLLVFKFFKFMVTASSVATLWGSLTKQQHYWYEGN